MRYGDDAKYPGLRGLRPFSSAWYWTWAVEHIAHTPGLDRASCNTLWDLCVWSNRWAEWDLIGEGLDAYAIEDLTEEESDAFYAALGGAA